MRDESFVRKEPSSFRDPSGFIFYRDGRLLRQINQSFESDYRMLMDCRLYRTLTDQGLLVAHEELGLDKAATPDAYMVIAPNRVPVITYPYEWCFSQLREAALTTLRIQRIALDHEMSLKDASAYNLQFDGRSTPLLIDTLSFTSYREGQPWVAYRQFCQHFLAPLALGSYCDIRLLNLLRSYVDGIPLDLASRLLPIRTRLSPALLPHIHLHSASQKRHSNDAAIETNRSKPNPRVSRLGFIGILDTLERAVRKLRWRGAETEWGDYYAATNYSDDAVESKANLIRDMLSRLAPTPEIVVDLGANTGRFSRLALPLGATVVASDIDPVAVERNYAQLKAQGETRVIPLLVDLTNPPGAGGWANSERPGLFERLPKKTVMALALIHHLAISDNLGLDQLAAFFGGICDDLIIEFVPKSDSQVKRLLASREDIFPDYHEGGFRQEFEKRFNILESHSIVGSDRRLFLMKSR